MESAIKYYQIKYEDKLNQAFVHLVREIGQIAFGMETNNKSVLEAKIIEAEALLRFLAHKYGIDTDKNAEAIYAKKLSQFDKKFLKGWVNMIEGNYTNLIEYALCTLFKFITW